MQSTLAYYAQLTDADQAESVESAFADILDDNPDVEAWNVTDAGDGDINLTISLVDEDAEETIATPIEELLESWVDDVIVYWG